MFRIFSTERHAVARIVYRNGRWVAKLNRAAKEWFS